MLSSVYDITTPTNNANTIATNNAMTNVTTNTTTPLQCDDLLDAAMQMISGLEQATPVKVSEPNN